MSHIMHEGRRYVKSFVSYVQQMFLLVYLNEIYQLVEILMKCFAENLKCLRTKLGFSMQDLADQAHISKSMISKIERLETQPTLDIASRIAKALGKKLTDMITDDSDAHINFQPESEHPTWIEEPNDIRKRLISPLAQSDTLEWLHLNHPAETLWTPRPQLSAMKNKCIHVLKGSISVKIECDAHILKKGDSLFIEANFPYQIDNQLKTCASYFITIS
jgi:transcriptional regulator with XRE-family HTH domain